MRAAFARSGPLLGVVACLGCSTHLGRLPLVVTAPERGVKMIRPNVVARACRSAAFGVSLGGDTDLVAAALAQLQAVDAEADVVTDVQVDEERLVTGLYDRDCVVLRGDVGREVSTVVLPRSPGHEHHEHAP